MIHVFEHKGVYVALDVNSGSIHAIDPITYDLLKGNNPEASEQEIEEAKVEIQQLKEKGLLDSEDNVFKTFSSFVHKPVIKAMCLHVAHDCNLACKYCFASQGSFQSKKEMMSLETGKKALDFLVKSSGSRHNLEVDFFGGEPLMNLSVVRELVKYGRSLEKEHDVRFRFTLTTNGVLLNDEVDDFINENMDNVVLSLDGTKKTNDFMRPTSSGKGSYDIIVPKFKKLVEKRKDKQYYLRGTYTSKNINFCEDVLHMADLGFESLSMEPVVCDPLEFYYISENDLPKIFDEYDKLADEIYKRRKKDRNFNFFHFAMDLSNTQCPIKRASGCGAGGEYISVTPSGEIYPCHQFVSDPLYRIGSLDEGIINKDLQQKFISSNVYSKPKCQDCWAKYYCSGGCHANAEHVNGDLSIPDEIGCKMHRKRLELAIYLKVKEALDDQSV